jgi:hypothetical protein
VTNLPAGTFSNANPPAPGETTRSVQLRDMAADVAASFTSVDYDPGAAIREILGMGEEQWEHFTRTELPNDEAINRWARVITLQLRYMENVVGWTHCPWLAMPRALAFLDIKAHLAVSKHRAGRKEAVMVSTHMVVPDWETDNQGRRPRRPRQ